MMHPANDIPRPHKPLHIVVTANAAWNVWNFRQGVIKALLAQSHRLTILAPIDEYSESLRELGCEIIPLDMDRASLSPRKNLGLIRRFRCVLEATRPDLLLSYTIKNNIYGAFAARSLGIPHIPNVSGLGTAFLSGSPLRLLAEYLYKAAFSATPAVLFQNPDDRELFVRRGLVRKAQAWLVPGSGVDLTHFTPAPYPANEAAPTFLLIARMLRDKGVVEFVEAARLVKQSFPSARFQLLGATGVPNRSAFDLATVLAWERTHGVEYLGAVPDVRTHIAAAHCVALPSYREGAPRTLIEAAAMARPIVATDVPGCRHVVDHGVTGFLCQVRDPTSLTEACLAFIALTHEQKIAMGAAGLRKMRNQYDEKLVVETYLQAIKACLDSSASGASMARRKFSISEIIRRTGMT